MNYKAIIIALLSFSMAIFLDGVAEQNRVLIDENTYLSVILYSAPNFISVLFVAIPFMFTAWPFEKILPGLVVGNIIYEFMQINLEWGTLDYMDIVFSIIAGFCSLLLYRILDSAGLIPKEASDI